VAGFEDEDSLPDEALPSSVGSSVSERSRENEAPHGGDYSGLSIVSRFTSVAFGSRKIRGGLPEIT